MAIILPTPKDRALFLSKQVDQGSILELSKSILDINKDDEYISKIYAIHDLVYAPKPIEVYIDSYGGSVYQCLGLVGIIQHSKTSVDTIVTGCAMSAGLIISISGKKRSAYSHATFLYHQVSSFVGGKQKDLEEEVIESGRLQKMLEDHTVKHTKIPKKKLTEIYNGKTDWYFSADEALKLGVIDRII